MCPVANLIGPPGPAGATWYTGNGIPSNTLGVNGDLYLDNTDSFYYLKIAGVWVFQGQLTSNSDGALDGGFANSVYLVSQVVDGGSA